ncbi:MAG: class D sortase [Lachnospiraceae bacterium]|nr:class D sortase [Lachnospiraceae bacterium]
MKWKNHLKSMLLSSLLVTFCVTQASALEYGFDGADGYLFAEPTSQDVIYQQENQNVNRSKTAALIAPGFGTPTSYLRGSGEYLTPNLAPGALSGGLVNSLGGNSYTDSGASGYPAADTSISVGAYPSADNGADFSVTTIGQGSTIGYTDVTSDLYYSGGHLGTLKIPAIGVNVKIYQGTDSATLAKGAGHFTDTSIWAGNVCIAGHNRGTNCYFGEIHTLNIGDEITLTTMLGTRTYSVTSVQKISETDNSATGSTSDNRVTLFTCVRNESAYRWCVTAVEKG